MNSSPKREAGRRERGGGEERERGERGAGEREREREVGRNREK